MRGVMLHGPGDVRVEHRADPTITQPTDAIIRVVRHLRVRVGPVALPRHRPGLGPVADGPRVRRRRRGGRQRRPHRSSRASSSSARSSPPTTPARSARPATSPAACTPSRWARSARRRSTRASRWPTARSSPRRTCRPRTWSRACWPPRTSWAPAGSARPRRRWPGQDRRCGGGRCGRTARGLRRSAPGRRAGHRHVPARGSAGARPLLRRDRHRRRARGRRRRPDQGPHRRARRPLRDRGGRHPGVDDAGHPLHPPRWARRLRRRLPRRELPGDELFFSEVHLHGGPAPVRRFLPELIDLICDRQIDPARSSTSLCPWTRPPRATAPWTSAARSRPCCSRDDQEHQSSRLRSMFGGSVKSQNNTACQADMCRRALIGPMRSPLTGLSELQCRGLGCSRCRDRRR